MKGYAEVYVELFKKKEKKMRMRMLIFSTL